MSPIVIFNIFTVFALVLTVGHGIILAKSGFYLCMNMTARVFGAGSYEIATRSLLSVAGALSGLFLCLPMAVPSYPVSSANIDWINPADNYGLIIISLVVFILNIIALRATRRHPAHDSTLARRVLDQQKADADHRKKHRKQQ
jgi:hypothetical protein